MSNYTVELEGTEELLRNLGKISNDIRGTVAVRAVDAGAQQIKGRAVINAPIRTGNLRNSAIVESRMNGGQAVAEIIFRREYARIQEFGGMAGRGRRVKIRGKHYLENAINSEKGLAVKAMGDVIREYLGE